MCNVIFKCDLFCCIGVETPRQCMDPIIDVLLALNKKYCEDLARWMPAVLGQENFPTSRPTVQEKEQFVQAVLRFVFIDSLVMLKYQLLTCS